MTTEEKKAEANRKRSESMRKAWREGKGTLGDKARRSKAMCKCGCGQLAELDRLYAPGHYDPGAAHRGKKHDAKWKKNQSKGLAGAHARGCFVDAAKKRKAETAANRPRCKCGCGKPVGAAKALYAKGCFDATTPENQAKAIAARDMEKMKEKNSVRLAAQMKEWKESGKLDEIRRKAGNAQGQLDHLAAKVWIIRDPYGNVFKFSNLAEWARQNEHRFKDDRPESKAPFWKRIAGGITDLLKKDGRSCSYRGWTAVSKLELEEGGADLLGRDYFMQNKEI